jgi:hypothetical protein
VSKAKYKTFGSLYIGQNFVIIPKNGKSRDHHPIMEKISRKFAKISKKKKDVKLPKKTKILLVDI